MPGLMKRDSLTSASTLADEETRGSRLELRARRHSEVFHGGDQRVSDKVVHPLNRKKFFLERTNSTGSIRLSLYKQDFTNGMKRKQYTLIRGVASAVLSKRFLTLWVLSSNSRLMQTRIAVSHAKRGD